MLAFKGRKYRFQLLGVCIVLFFSQPVAVCSTTEEFQFNTDVLDVNDRENIDLGRFSRSNYIMPGTYGMVVHVNQSDLPEMPIEFYSPEFNPQESQVCLSPELVKLLGLKESLMPSLSWLRDGKCLDIRTLKGIEARGDLASSSLYLSIPQAYLEYTADNWEPPSRWDDGIFGLLLDYNLYAQTQKNVSSGQNSHTLSGNGTTGTNLQSWRLRADWQSIMGSGGRAGRKLEWSRYYAYRALPKLGAKLTLGEDYLSSGVFDSFRFTGASLRSDDNMLPPNLRGYAPEVVGVARTNAKVIISQQGRVLYQTQVATGPFRIQDINDAVSGQLNVRVEEQDGSVQEFTMNTANIPYLTRPGMVRYKLAAGRPSDLEHRTQGSLFGIGEFSWGINNGWSLYGGALGGSDYNAMSLGLGRDLLWLGALSFDVTQSWAQMPIENRTLSGSSYKLSYSKSFEEYDSQIAFAGYRFSQEDFMSMSEYLDMSFDASRRGKSKEMYTVSFNKHFRDSGLSAYLNYDHQSYWDRSANDRYQLSLSRYFDLGRFRNLNLSLTAFSSSDGTRTDDGMYLSLSMPWGNSGTLSYNSTLNRNDNTNSVGYYNRIDDRSNYQINAGNSRSGLNMSGNFTHYGDIATVSTNASYGANNYRAFGVSTQGGMTLTAEGSALHRSSFGGGTRLLLDTGGVANIPVRGYGSSTRSNRWGKAVVVDVNNYYRNRASINLNELGDKAEATNSVVQATLTEGAIGYRKFDIISGDKAMAIIKLADGGEPPFGATVINSREQEVGIINDSGSVYLSGINAGARMTVHWNGQAQCEVLLPQLLPEDLLMNTLLLPCHELSSKNEMQPDTKSYGN